MPFTEVVLEAHGSASTLYVAGLLSPHTGARSRRLRGSRSRARLVARSPLGPGRHSVSRTVAPGHDVTGSCRAGSRHCEAPSEEQIDGNVSCI